MAGESQRQKFAELHTRNQAALVDLLRTDLDLGFTFLQMANVTGDRGHARQAVQRATAALEGIRRLSERIENRDLKSEIRGKADELEKAIDEFSN
jgi:hypothetical protein